MATAGYDDGTVKVWDANTHRLRLVLQGDGDRIWCVAFSPDATLIAAGGSHSDYANVDTVKIWNATTGKIMLSVNAGWVWSIAFSPDGKLLATGSERGIVKLWNLANGRESIPIRGHGTAVKCVAFCPDGKVLATGSADKSIRLWDVVTGDERGRLTGHAHWVSSLSFSPDGTLLASGDWGGTIRLWRASSSQ